MLGGSRLIVVLIAAAALVGCRGGDKVEIVGITPLEPVARGHDPWVFRATLDERPRSVVVALQPGLWVAYDGATGGVFRVASQPVNFEGAVYTGGHGPQPTTQPPNYEQHDADATGWFATDAGGGRHALSLLSYTLNGERSVELRWGVRGHAWASSLVVKETPEVALGPGVAWFRQVEVAGLPGGWSLTQQLGPEVEGRTVTLVGADSAEPLASHLVFERDTSYTLLTRYEPVTPPDAEATSFD